MSLHESAEMYLETIYLLSQKTGTVRSIDIAEYMGYSKPSVSRAVNLLKKGGYLTMGEDSYLSHTESGRTAAKKVFERHTVLSDFLARIGVNDDIAAKDACKIEHDISDKSFNKIKEYLQNHNLLD